MNQKLLVFILALSTLLLCFSVFHTMERYGYEELLLSETDFQNIQNNRTESRQKLLNGITFKDMPLIFDEKEHRWFYTTQPDGFSSDMTVDFSAAAKNVKIGFIGEPSPGNSMQLIAYTDTEYETGSIEITSLPLITIEGEDSEIPFNTAMPIVFSLYENGKETRNPVILSDGSIHVRGNWSRFYPKKSFKINLTSKSAGGEQKENHLSLLGMRKDDDWLLYPAYNDQEKIRNVFSNNLWFSSCAEDNSFGLKNGMEYRYVELFLNHQYWGLYAIGYPVDAKQMQIRPNGDGHYEEFLFKQKTRGPENKDYSALENYLFLQFDADVADRDYGLSIMRMYFEHIDENARNGLYNNDEKNALDTWLFLKLIQARDSIYTPGQINNIIYTIKNINGTRKILYTPWDMDAAWGNGLSSRHVKNGSQIYHYRPSDNEFEMTLSPVSVMLYQNNDPKIVRKIKQRYAELRSGGWSDQAVGTMLDVFEQDIYDSGAYIRDMERWPDGAYQDPELKLSKFKTYVHERFLFMDDFIEGLP